MPASQRSLRLTQAYRQRQVATRARIQQRAQRTWPSIEALDSTDWVERMAASLAQAQATSIRLAAAYLTAFLASETGKRPRQVPIDSRPYAGRSRDGRPLDEALRSPIIGVLAGLKEAYGTPSHVVTVTPAMAQEWLAGGTHGGLDPARVDELAAKMRSREWDATLGKIMLTRDGFVFDGQHRLEAVIRNGEPIRMGVAEGLPNPIKDGLVRATRMVGVDFDNAHHAALLQTIADDDRFDGWNRSLAGTCGACASVASGVSHALHFPVHPSCQCVASPVVKGVANTFPVPTGVEVFKEKTKEQQDEMLGPDAAALVRADILTLDDLRGESDLAEGPNFITQKPLTAVT